jgi:hypothetical protein
MTTTTAAMRVAAGAAVLDFVRPSWREELNLVDLDVMGLTTCPLGQLWGSYGNGLGALGHPNYATQEAEAYAIRHGFEVEGDDDYETLTELWVAEARR